MRGEDLRAAEQWLAQAGTQKERQPTALQTEYIIASRKASARRQRITLGAVTFGLVVAIVLAIVAFFAEGKAKKQTEVAVAATKRTSEVASRGNVSLAGYSKESGKNAQALAQLALALRLNPENRNASGFAASILTHLGWHVPLSGSMRHGSDVTSAQFSPDGRRVVTTSKDKTARLWDAASAKPIAESMKHDEEVNSTQFSPDGQRVVTASNDKTARLWDAATGKPIGEPMKHDEAVNSAQFSPDGQRVVTASRDKTARLWDAATGKVIGQSMKHAESINSAQFSPDEQRVVTASSDKTARLWDAASGKPIGEPMIHYDEVNLAQFSPDGQRVVSASRDYTARLWDAATGKPIGEPMIHDDRVNWAQFSPDGRRVVTASEDTTARLWDAASGKPLGEPMKHEGRVPSAQFSLDGQRVLIASEDKTARLWDAAISMDKDTTEDVLLLAELAEATGGVALETVGQAENLTVLTPEQSQTTRKKIAAKYAGMSSRLTSLQRFLKWSGNDERTLHLAIALALVKEPAARIVWVIDQFEEVFTLCSDEKERASFLANLLYVSSIPDGQCSVVLTMRTDFLPKCAAYPDLAARVAAQQFLVSQMDGQMMRQVVKKPARSVGLRFEAGLVETILGDGAGEPGALPLLEHALLEVWKRGSEHTLTLDGYRQSGGVRGAIAETAKHIQSLESARHLSLGYSSGLVTNNFVRVRSERLAPEPNEQKELS